MYRYLSERLTFDQLFRASEPKRIRRASTVRGPPLQITAYSDSVWHTFNFKSHPSTTGLRHHGFIRFFRPRNNQPIELQHVPCMVDCTCPDFRYRWAWVLKNRGSSRVGVRSMNQALNLPPNITNPRKHIGLCKHILALRDYIYGMLAAFPGGERDPGETLDQLVRYAQGRWSDFPGQMASAREREAWFKAAKQARNAGLPLPPGLPEPYRVKLGPGLLPAVGEEPAPEIQGIPEVPRGGPELRRRGRPGQQLGQERIPGRQGREGRPPRPQRGESLIVPVMCVGMMDERLLFERMKNLTEALQIIEALPVDAVDAPPPSELPPSELPPSEPPMDDTAVGADTQGNVVVGLLSDIKDLLAQLVDVDLGEEEPLPDENADELAVEVPEPGADEQTELETPSARPMPPE
jgi:hypothetical protein